MTAKTVATPKTEPITSPVTHVRFSSFAESLGIDIGIVDVAIGARVIVVPLSIVFQVCDTVPVGADVIARDHGVVVEPVAVDSKAPSFEIREAWD
jgi:hypothetical protein